MPREEFYDHPMVRRLVEIFDDPQPPARITEKQFDDCQKELEDLARRKWHEMGLGLEFNEYILDLAYVPLQQDLFDYLFPAFLILWWQGQLTRTGGPAGESDLYYALDRGQALEKMMSPHQKKLVLDWMTDAYMQGVDEWSGNFSTTAPSIGLSLQSPLWSFHAIGQSLPLIPQLWNELCRIETAGRAHWCSARVSYGPPIRHRSSNRGTHKREEAASMCSSRTHPSFTTDIWIRISSSWSNPARRIC